MKAGVHHGISRANYNAIEALNISLLIEGERSMAHLDYARKHPKESTPAMEKGTALHLAVFEPAEFEKKVKVYDGIRRGKAWDAFLGLLENTRQIDPIMPEGLIILKPDTYQSIVAMRDELNRHERVKELLTARGSGEMGVVWQDAETGIWCKGLIDRVCSCWGWTTIVDLKSCQDARFSEFAKTVYNLGYHTKAAWYTDGLNAAAPLPQERRFLWIAIESEPFHGVAIHEPSTEMMNAGRRNYRNLLTQYSECQKTGVWTSYPNGEDELELPKWSK